MFLGLDVFWGTHLKVGSSPSALVGLELHLASTVQPLIVLLCSPARSSYSLLGVWGVSSLLMQVGVKDGRTISIQFQEFLL